MKLRGKVAIVTGSGGAGCGRAIARRLAREGCPIVVSDIDDKGAEETARLIATDGRSVTFFHCDVRRRTEVQALVQLAEDTFGGLDILVNNASAPFRPQAPMEDWHQTIETDLIGSLYGVQLGVEAMQRRGGGAILNVSSTSALGHGPDHSTAPAYDIAKAGVLRLTTALGRLQSSHNIRVNCLVPDWVATPEVKSYYDHLTPEERRHARIPPALTSLEETAEVAIRLISDSSLAGRALVWWSGRVSGLLPLDDPGYARLEPFVESDS